MPNKKYLKLTEFNNRLKTLIDLAMEKKASLKEPKDMLVAFTLAKAYKTHSSILVLCKQQHGQDAAMLVRTIFDLLVTTSYVLKDDSANKMKRYMAFDWILRKRIHNKAKSIKGYDSIFDRGDSLTTDSLKTIIEESDKAEEKFKFGRCLSWSGKTIAEMSEAVGLIGVYKTVFALQSDLVHSNSRSMLEYVKVSDNQVDFNIAQDPKWVEESLVASFDFMIRILDKYNDNFKLGLDKELQDLLDDFVPEMKKINSRVFK